MSTQPDAGIYTREFPSLERCVQLGTAGGRVLSVSFPATPDPGAETEHPLLDRIEAYLAGTEDDFGDVDVAMTMPTDRREVFEALRGVPYGESITVETLTRMTGGLDHGAEADRRLVRTALSENPAPIFIPDHRVTDGPSAAPSAVEGRLRSLEGL
jgi:methylated-DNA-[protein]-cysteine S-methyltransferase